MKKNIFRISAIFGSFFIALILSPFVTFYLLDLGVSAFLSKKFCIGNFDSVICLTSFVSLPVMAVLVIPIFFSFRKTRKILAFSFVAALIGMVVGCYLFLMAGQGI